MLIKKCARCGALMPYGGSYCAKCAPIVQAEQERRRQERRQKWQKQADQRRKDNKETKFYHSAEWRRLSKAYLQARGWRCERCGKIAECVHHKQYLRSPGGWERREEWGNLEALCSACHAEEHERNRGRRKA